MACWGRAAAAPQAHQAWHASMACSWQQRRMTCLRRTWQLVGWLLPQFPLSDGKRLRRSHLQGQRCMRAAVGSRVIRTRVHFSKVKPC